MQELFGYSISLEMIGLIPLGREKEVFAFRSESKDKKDLISEQCQALN